MALRAPFAIAFLTACGQPFWNSPPNVRAMPAKDSRQDLTGRWTIELTLDSVQQLIREPYGVRSVMVAAAATTVVGTLVLYDTIVGPDGNELRSEASIDFSQLLGRPLSCYDPNQGLTTVRRKGARVNFRLTPNAYDCGFYAEARLVGDSMIGTWNEAAFVGAPAMGRLRMKREPRAR